MIKLSFEYIRSRLCREFSEFEFSCTQDDAEELFIKKTIKEHYHTVLSTLTDGEINRLINHSNALDYLYNKFKQCPVDLKRIIVGTLATSGSNYNQEIYHEN